MEAGEDYEFLPVAVKKRGSDVPDALADAQQLGMLAGHIDRTLQQLAAELGGGKIAAEPYYKSGQKNACVYCQYKEMCGFEDGQRGEHCRRLPDYSTQTVWNMIEEQEEGGCDHGI